MEAVIKNIYNARSVIEELNIYIAAFSDADENMKSDIISLIKKNHPNHSKEAIYKKNIVSLKDYPNIGKNVPNFEDIDIHILYSSRDFLLYHIISRNELILKKYDYDKPLFPNELYLFSNELNICRLLDIHKKTRYPASAGSYFSDEYRPRPLYLYYENNDYFSIFTVFDILPLLKNESTLFFFSKRELTDFFSDFYCAFPSVMPDELMPLLQDLRAKRQKKIDVHKHNIKKYYKENSDNIIKNIVNGKPKILFLSTLFGFSGRNTMADLAQGFVNCGYETKVFVNKSRVHLFSGAYAVIDEFKPDIALSVNAFRYHFPELSEEIVYINWHEDPMTFLEFGERDFILEHCPIEFSDISRVSVCPTHITDGLIRSNPNIYKIRTLTQEELDKYACDVAMVIGAGDIRSNSIASFEHYIDDYIKLNRIVITESEEDSYKMCTGIIFDTFYTLIYNEKIDYYDLNKVRQIMDDIFYNNISSSSYNKELVNFIIKTARLLLIPEIYRLVITAWISEISGIKFKIWGTNWEHDQKFKQYANGSASGGEMLSKIYNASKITVGNNCCFTCPGRFFESTMSGCLHIGNTIPEHSDFSNRIIKQFKEDEVVFFKNKRDLHEKIKYYLEHEEERKAFNERGRKRILKDLTYDSFVENAMSQIKTALKKQL